MQNPNITIEILSSQENSPRVQAPVVEGTSLQNTSTEVAVESGIGSRSASSRNLMIPLCLATSIMGFGFGICSAVAADRYPRILMPNNPSNTTLAYVNEYNQQQQEAIWRFLDETMIPIASITLVALLLQQSWSYMQRNGLIGPRRQMIEESRAISADLVFNHNPINADRPSPSLVEGREGESLSSPPVQLQQARPPRYVV